MNYKFMLKYFIEKSMIQFNENIVSKYPINNKYSFDIQNKIYKEMLTISTEQFNLYTNKVFEVYYGDKERILKQFFIDIKGAENYVDAPDLNPFANMIMTCCKDEFEKITSESIDDKILETLFVEILQKAVEYQYFEEKDDVIILP